MKNRSGVLFTGAAWQILRFTLLMVFIIIAVYPQSDPRFMLLFVWPAATQLIIAAGCFFLAWDEKKYRGYRNLLILGKVLDFVPGFLLLGLQLAAVYFGRGAPMFQYAPFIDMITRGAIESVRVFHYALAAVVVFDLIFLLVLISFRVTPEEPESTASNDLPEYAEVQLEDEKW